MSIKIKVDGVNYSLCKECGVHRNPVFFTVKGKKRKACSGCRTKK